MEFYELTEAEKVELVDGYRAIALVEITEWVVQKRMLEHLFSKCNEVLHDGWPNSKPRLFCPHCIANIKRDFALGII